MQENLWPFSLSHSIKPVKLWLQRLMLSSPRGSSPRNGVFYLHWCKETLTPNLLVAISVLLNPQRRLDKLHLIIMPYPGEEGGGTVKISSYHSVIASYSRDESLLNPILTDKINACNFAEKCCLCLALNSDTACGYGENILRAQAAIHFKCSTVLH